MVSVSIRVEGTQRLRVNLRGIQREFPEAVFAPASKKAAERGARYARANKGFRNRTFKLVRSIGVSRGRSRRGRFVQGYALVMGNARAYYARFIEFGTEHINARRTLQRAYQYLRARAFGIIVMQSRRDFRSAVRRSTRRTI